MIDIYQLQHLVAIADAKTLSRASEILHISQPGLTRSIQRLEDDLNIKLFDRTRNKISLNDNGKLAVKYAKKILHDIDNMHETLQAFERSKRIISIGSCAPAPIWGLTNLCNRLYPENMIDSQIISDENTLINDLYNHKYTMIILNHPLHNEDIICIELIKENLYISVSPAHPLALFKEITLDKLNGESVLLLSKIGFWNELCIKNLPESHLLLQDNPSIFDELVKVSALPNFRTNLTILREPEEKNRISIPIIDDCAQVTYYLIMKKETKKIFNIDEDDLNSIQWNKI